MNISKNILWLLLSVFSLTLTVASCSEDEEMLPANGKGYLQLHLQPAGITRAIGDLSDARKLELELDYDGLAVKQTLTLNGVSHFEGAGLTTDKLELLPGNYRLMSYVVYGAVKPGDSAPKELLTGYPDDAEFTITAGHITEMSLSVQATLSGKVSFNLKKDLSNYQDAMDEANQPSSRAEAIVKDPTLFNYDNVKEVDVTYRRGNRTPVTITTKVYNKSGEDFLHTDTLRLEAGEYTITELKFYSVNRQYLLLATNPNEKVVVAPVMLTRADVKVTYPKNMKAIQDYMALYNIWKALDGENWSYLGEGAANKANWRFKNRPVDQWGNQPGVVLDNDGRVTAMDLGSFGPKGEVPECIGNLSELGSLWLGTHNDMQETGGVVSYKLNVCDLAFKGIDIRANRLAIAREQLAMRHYKPSLFNDKKRTYRYAVPAEGYDVDKDARTNGITGLPETMGNLKKLEVLYIANGEIRDLPQSLANLTELTDLELYNCRLDRFPEALKKMTGVIALNMSNTTIKGDDDTNQMVEGLNALAKSSNNLQLLYLVDCGITHFPMNFLDAANLVMLDMAGNKLTLLPQKQGATGKPAFAPIQAFFDNNRITAIEENFCGTDDIETFSASENFIRQFPLVFKKGAVEGKYSAETIDLSYNRISDFTGFEGIRTQTLKLNGNRMGQPRDGKNYNYFPSAFAQAYAKSTKRVVVQNLETGMNDIDSIKYDDFKCFKNLEAWDLSGNRLRYIPYGFNVEAFPYMTGLSLNQNCFERFPVEVFNVLKLYKLFINGQTKRGLNGNRTEERSLREFPEGMSKVFGLRFFDISGNDIRKVSENDFPASLFELNISDNPNIEMTIPAGSCQDIAQGIYTLIFDASQYILGCPALDLDINK